MPQEIINKLMGIGVRPSWLGEKKDGTVLEYCSLPWVAGNEIFILVRKPDNPNTVECVELRKVKPLQLGIDKKAA